MGMRHEIAGKGHSEEGRAHGREEKTEGVERERQWGAGERAYERAAAIVAWTCHESASPCLVLCLVCALSGVLARQTAVLNHDG